LSQKRTADPTTYSRAMNSVDSDKWFAAMESEMASLRANSTAILVPYKPHMSVITGNGCNIKIFANGEIARYKARYVCRGYTQQYVLITISVCTSR
jgi:hypothetical protein